MSTLTERQEKLLDLFKGAIERERGAQGAYREMLPFSDDPGITQIIERFARQEEEHEETLLKLYKELRTDGGEFSDLS